LSDKLNDSEVRKKALKVAEYLDLKYTGRNSFVSLCEKGCDAEELGNYFKLLTSKSEIEYTRTYIGKRKRFATSREHAERMRQPQHVIDSRPMDSFETALDGFQKRDIENLQKKLKKVSSDIEKLNNTKLVGSIDRHKFHREVFNMPTLLDYYAGKFINLILKEYDRVGEKQRPDYTKLMKGLYKHVRDKTKGWHDALIAEILYQLTPERQDSELSLKQWRKRHGIIERRGTRKRKKL
jgi:hypothetical protein